MPMINANKRKKLISLGLITLVILFIAIAKFVRVLGNSGWTDFYETSSETIAPAMNISQIEASLEDALKQYEVLITSSNRIDKNEMVSDLDKLYQLSANDYTNATALKDSSKEIQTLDDLTQSATFLTSSIFEMKDSLMNEGNFSTTQLNESKQDLASAIREIERVRQELKK